MPASRRALLAAALATVAGCVGTRPSTGTATESETDEPATGGPGSERPTRTTDTPADSPAFARWTRETSADALGEVTLAPAGDGPAVYVAGGPGGSSTDGEGPGHFLAALTLQQGDERWRADLPNPVRAAPLWGGDEGPPRLYVATARPSLHGQGSELVVFDPSSGERVWTFDTEDPRFLVPLVAADGTVYVGRRDDLVGSGDEYVYALEAADGAERWRAGTGDARGDGHAVRRDTLFANTWGGLRAFDRATGDGRWGVDVEIGLDGPAYDSRGKRVFVGHEGVVRALSVSDGSEIWRREFDFEVSRVATPREAMSTTVFVGDAGGRLLALSPLDGGTRWTLAVDSDGFAPTVARTSETLFVADGGIYALDPVSGERQWTFAPDGEWSLDVHASTTVFASDVGGERLWALDPASGDERWTFAPAGRFAGPAHAGDFAFVGVGGTVLALDGTGEP